MELDKLVQILKDNPTVNIELASHTDARATDAYNNTLSAAARAQSAVNYLISRGIDADRLTAKGYGETQLIVPNAKTEEEHQRNRRTEFYSAELLGALFSVENWFASVTGTPSREPKVSVPQWMLFVTRRSTKFNQTAPA